MSQARGAGARVGDRQADAKAPKGGKGCVESFVVVDGRALGDLERDPLGRHVPEEFAQFPGATGARGHVDVQHDRGIEVAQTGEGATDRGDLQLDAEPDLGCLGEPEVGGAQWRDREAAEGFGRDGPPVGEVEDRLIDHLDAVAVEERLDAAARLATPERPGAEPRWEERGTSRGRLGGRRAPTDRLDDLLRSVALHEEAAGSRPEHGEHVVWVVVG